MITQLETVRSLLNIGDVTYNDNTKYEGNWNEGKANGKGIKYINIGTYYLLNGDKYEGDWVNGVIEGNGIGFI